MIEKYGIKKWYLDDKLHRADGPAVEFPGTKMWFLDGEIHRIDGPASEQNNTKSWYQYGKLHRMHGPAIEHSNGFKEWYIQGQHYTKEKYKIEMSSMGIERDVFIL